MRLVLDTHAVLWYLENSTELSTRARAAIIEAFDQTDNVFVSAVSLVEAVYLFERGKITPLGLDRLRRELRDPNSGLVVANLDAAIAEALEQIPRSSVPEMPDRIVAATALHLDAPLVTRDRML